MKSELLQTLELVEHMLLWEGPNSAFSLCQKFDVSIATLKRRIDDARHLGAHIESLKLGHQWCYHLGNPESVEPRLTRWLELERRRSLV